MSWAEGELVREREKKDAQVPYQRIGGRVARQELVGPVLRWWEWQTDWSCCVRQVGVEVGRQGR